MKQILLFILCTLTISIFAQKDGQKQNSPNIGRVYGKIKDAVSKEVLAYASVTIVSKMPDGSEKLINGTLTEENGDFNITALPFGVFLIKIDYMAYADFTKEIRITGPNLIEQDLGDILLKVDEQQLSTVEVQAEKATLNMNLEKKVFNVDKNFTSTGGTAEDVMKNIPAVSVDTDGNAKLRDRSATIYVDGKPTMLTLNQIPSDQVESIEVISNPSAKYEAAAMGGILNIVLKQNRKAGYNGMIGLGAGTQGRYNANINANVNKGKWNFGTFYTLNNSQSPTQQYVKTIGLDSLGKELSYFNQNSSNTFKHLSHSARVNVDYAADNRNTITLAASFFKGNFDMPVSQDFEYLSQNNVRTASGNRTTLTENDFTRKGIEAVWKKTFATKNKSLTTFFNYGWGDKYGKGNWTTNNYDKEGNLLDNNPELVKTNDFNANDQITFQVDYVNPLSESTKIEMGVRSFWSDKDQYYFFNTYDYTSKSYITTTSLSQDARIIETINAAYFMFSSKTKFDLNYQAGLRFEQSGLSGLSRLEGQGDFGYDYPRGNAKDILRSLFPSLHIAKNLNDATELGFNFSRKIQRPNFRQLMPGVRSNDKQNIEIGNPSLQPEFINLAELSFRKIFGQNNFMSTLYYSNETNTIKPFTSISPSDSSVLVTQYINGDNELMLGLDNTLKLLFGKNTDIMISVNIFKFDVTVNNVKNTGWANNSKLNVNYKFPLGFSLQANAGYEGNRPMPQGNRKGIGYADLAIKKTLSKNGSNLVFSISDLFNSRKDITTVTLPSYIQESLRRRESRYFKLTFQLPFGKLDAMAKKPSKKSEGQDMQEF